MENYELVIIGGGPAGMAAACAAYDEGARSILVLERDERLGGILNQCIHNGFGLHTFQEELTGPEYAGRFEKMILEKKIECRLNTMVIHLSKERCITAMSRDMGLYQIQAGAVILAMGCRERPRGALNIPGYRPAGIYSAGTAQKLVNTRGEMPGREVVILGSGDIGLIMARRMTLEGAKVKLVAEVMPYSGGLKRNIVQCLDDYQIPLKLSHTVIDIEGKDRVEAVTVAQVDSNRKVIAGTQERITCDTLLLSVGLIPENELSKEAEIKLSRVTNGPVVNESFETNIPGIFACGNVLHVHDLVDYVSEEASHAGRKAAQYAKDRNGQKYSSNESIEIQCEKGIRYTVPSVIRMEYAEEKVTIRFRVDNVYRKSCICIYDGEQLLRRIKKNVLAPGEMEKVELTRETLKNLKQQKLKLCVEKQEE